MSTKERMCFCGGCSSCMIWDRNNEIATLKAEVERLQKKLDDAVYHHTAEYRNRQDLELQNRELEAAKENFNKILNYWYPRLGYTKANEMSYPALGDSRAFPAPNLKNAD